ncbi:putative DNA-binding protein [Streptomyces albus]|uniref:Putative DNA-binding protein n=1 Tax=Streptomyces albus (strain ATCC 21838 / DSM 41398 / FERM P-419 / JCM 4703 / NBRC 107858) TaxID=1081613 RepID=A0A0B5EZV7_STRA4|nr:putative DNA-binding protein [Streptomyces albus]AOU78456.1 putative DNA-binding protein [Streptomyces albus]AYN34202.1 transcriptional regulator [Streptomyces albus]
MSGEHGLGDRLREIRKRRGLSQRELAQASRVSLSLITKLEQGVVTDTRMETARKLAAALRVPTTSLVSRTPAEPRPAPEPWQALQRSVELPAGQPEEEPTMRGVLAGLQAVRAAHFGKRMREAVDLLVPLLRDAEALGDDPAVRGARAQLLQIAGSTLTGARQFAAAETALRRALDEAPDRLRAASVVTTWTWLLVRQGRFDAARELAVKWADDAEPRMSRATAEEIAAWGWLLIQGHAAALRDNRAGEAADMLRLARSAAVATGPLRRGEVRIATWGPATVAYKAAEQGVVLDRPDEVLEMAPRLKNGAGSEYHRHRLDVAKAYTMTRQHGHALEVLEEVAADAPQWIAEQRYARDTLADTIARRRTLTDSTRRLADLVGLPL